ncbi:Homeobox-like domain superfamily [Arabidopsis suecica]|uniref:Homeobox-like domain superfamily n=1 Tax=Arabidopsis suecica TaxID=45249 RepID=A0A8T2AMV0_ARASU|nr:Homeobox-like domain superfamily [Arabidopsis suecica]
MANPPWTNEEMNHHKAYSGNLTTPSESSSLKSQSGIAMNWTSEEDERLVQLLDSYSSESSGAITRYSKIAAGFENKTIRDVAVRSRWIYKKKENAKRRKEDHNGLGRARVDNKEIIDMVVAAQVFQPSQVGVENELLKQNEQWFNQICANSTSLSLTENMDLFSKIRENINSLIKNLNENVSETWKHMPPLREKLNDELFCDLYKAISPSANLP